MAEAIPSLADTVATLVGWAEGTGALAVGVLIPQGDDVSPALVRYDHLEGVLSVAEGEEMRTVPALDGLGGTPLGELHLHKFPDFDVDDDEGKIVGAIGGLENLARTLGALAGFFGPEALAAAEFRTADGGAPLEIGSGAAGGYAISRGDIEFEIPDGWPDS